MKISTKRYFEEAKKAGIEPFQLTYSTQRETSVEVFNGEVETQQIGTSTDIGGKGILEGKQGSFGTDFIDSATPELMMKKIVESAKFGKEEKAENYYHNDLDIRYRKAKTDLKDFKPATLKELRKFAVVLSHKVQQQDPRLAKVFVSVTMEESRSFKENSYGVRCQDKMRLFVGSIGVVAEDEKGEPRSGGEMFYSFLSLDDLAKEADRILERTIRSALDFFGTGPVKGKPYKIVFSPSSFSSLLSFYLGQFDAKNVQKHLSVFEGKKDAKIASSSLTLLHTPHTTCPSSSSYDADGVPTQDFTLLKNGVLKTYFYSVETAREDKVPSNGCASGSGYAGPICLTVKPGRSTKEDLFRRMKNGLYITFMNGLNSGINGQTLDFSLPCAGYVVSDGKIEKATSMILIAGNLRTLFEDIIALGNDSEYAGGCFTPSVLVRKLSVSGQ